MRHGWVIGTAAVATTIGASWLLTSSTTAAAIGAPLAFGAVDAAIGARLHGVRALRPRALVVFRLGHALAWGIALVGANSVAPGQSLAPHARWVLTGCAILATLGTIFGTWGSPAASRQAVRKQGAVVGLLDALVMVWAVYLALQAHAASSRVRVIVGLAMAAAMLGRSLCVEAIARRGRAPSTSLGPALTVFGFTGWLGTAALTCTIAGTAIAWSGFGAAMVLTAASLLAESRRKRGEIALMRATLGWSVATWLGTLAILSR